MYNIIVYVYVCAVCTHNIIAEHSRVVVCPMNREMSIDAIIYMLYTFI